METSLRRRRFSRREGPTFLLAIALCIPGCGGAPEPGTPAPAAPASAAPPPQAKASSAPFVPADACALLSRADVEALAGKKVLEGRKEAAGPLVTCSFGDPEAPQVGGRTMSQVLTLSVMTGEDGAYFAGPVAQVKDAFQMARKNAGSTEGVSGLGEDAYWDSVLSQISFVKGRHFVTVDVEADGGGLTLARSAATRVLERLPP